jgi:hypothetical protein
MSISSFLLATRCGLGDGPATDPETIRKHLQEIVQRPEFRSHQQDLSWLARVFRELFAWLGSLYDTWPALFWVLLIGCLTLLALILLHVTWTLRQAFIVSAVDVASREAAERRARLSRACEEKAREQALRGEFTEAIRYLFLSLVYHFDEEGRVLFERGRTNREYLALFAERPRLGADLQIFVDFLDEHWYGQQPTDSRHYEVCRTLFERLQHQG